MGADSLHLNCFIAVLVDGSHLFPIGIRVCGKEILHDHLDYVLESVDSD